MNVRRLVFASLVLVLTAACQPSTTAAPAAPSEADLAAIKAVSNGFVAGFMAGDMDAVAAAYAEDAVLMPPNAPPVRGRAAIREFMATFPPVAEITLTDEHFEVVGDLAVAYGKYTLTFGVEGVPADTGSYMDIRKRQADGSWAYAADIFNSDLPAPAAAPAP